MIGRIPARAPARVADRAADLVALAVVASVGLAAAPVTWRLLGHDDGRHRVAAVAAVPPAPPVDVAAVKRFAPFGSRAGGPDDGLAGDPTALGLQLRGILLARPASASTALIAVAGGPARGFAVGATLPGGSILDAVEFDLVVLRAGGRLLTLALPNKPGAASAAAPATAAPAGPDGPAAIVDPTETTHPGAPDPQSLLGSLDASAGADGFRVGQAPPDDLRRAGLQPGDIIEKVNGEAIGDPAHDRQLFDDAVVAGSMRVDVVRGGRHVALAVTLH